MSVCPSVVRCRVLRATRLDECGVPVAGDMSTVVSSGFTTIGLSPQYIDPEDIQVKNANDDLCVNDLGKPQLSTIQVEIDFCKVDPDLFTLITGETLVLDDSATPQTVGFKISEGIVLGRFALEAWSNISGQSCANGTPAYWYHLLPLISNAQWGDVSFENAAVSFTITGTTLPGSGWGTGPYDVINDNTGAPSPLLAASTITAQDHYLGEQTTLTPPTPSCGFQTLTPVPSFVTQDVLAKVA